MPTDEIFELEMNPADIFLFPSNYEILQGKSSAGYLVAFAEQGKYIVLRDDNDIQAFLLASKGYSLEKILNNLSSEIGDELAQISVQNLIVEYFDKIKDNSSLEISSDYSLLTLNITEECNLRCKHCYRYSGVPLENEISDIVLLNILEQHISRGGKILRISGGEPLLRKETTINLIKLAKKRDLKVLLLTNGTLFSSELTRLFIHLKVDRIQVSLDGIDEESCSSVRGPGVFNKVIKGLSYFRGSDVKLFIAIVLIPDLNMETMLSKRASIFFNNLKSYYGEQISISVGQGLLDGREVERVDCTENIRKCRNLQNIFMGSESNAILDLWRWESGSKITSCGFSCNLTVEPDGAVKTCAIGKTIANVNRDSLDQVVKKLKEEALTTHIDKIESCRKCPVRYLCGGPCRVENDSCNPQVIHDVIDRIITSNDYRYEMINEK